MATPIPPNQARFSIDEVVCKVHGSLVCRGVVTAAVGMTTDSRAVEPGGGFVALRGRSHDGHAFVDAAVERGAVLLVVERGRSNAWTTKGPVSVVEVDDTLVAWGDLARAHIEAWRAKDEHRRTLAITGSAGKTTTKEMTAALLGALGNIANVANVHCTPGNLNNRIGMPAVVLGLSDVHRFAVVEMGMSVPGEIDAMASIAQPDVAVVVNVALAHAQGVGGREGIMREKGGVYRALLKDGVAVVNVDDDFARRAADGIVAKRKVSFGRAAGANYRLVHREPLGVAGSKLVVSALGRELIVTLPIAGEAAAIDFLAALALQETASRERLSEAGIDLAFSGLHIAGRAEIKVLGSGTLVLDDTYNANPSSMRAALSTLAEVGAGRRLVAVLGEMKELGDLAEEEHRVLGDAIAHAGVSLAIGCGGMISLALDRARAQGVAVVDAPSTEAAAAQAVARIFAGDAILVKGSRSVGTEFVVSALTEVLPPSPNSASYREASSDSLDRGTHR
ncbi:MAG: UDP-N-acetylmuramoyl-tripeptide--D-alanyl-D-alanine ligase [Polyangiaceae bacterium]|nr:UDP-N-acetylmuramoyl-tripeptide--D-alanyl-D-alanine ligase [Polyangiaceae bacterium]